MLLCKKNAQEVVSRLTELFSGRGRDKIYACMNIIVPDNDNGSVGSIENETDTDVCSIGTEAQYTEASMSEFEPMCHAMLLSSEIEDDSMPYWFPQQFDEGLYGALVGGDIKFINGPYGVSSMVYPFIKNLDEVKQFRLDESNIWYNCYKRTMEMAAKAAKGRFILSDIISISGLNFLVELVGATETYYAILEEPEKARYAVDFSVKLNIWLRETFFNAAGLQCGGSVIYGYWCPGKVVNESVDPFHLTSADTFEEWGREPLERIFAHFDGGIVHIHGNGHHLIRNVAGLKGLKLMIIGDDGASAPIHETVNEISSRAGATPVALGIPYELFVDKLVKKELAPNIIYGVNGVPDMETANRLMKDVKKYRT